MIHRFMIHGLGMPEVILWEEFSISPSQFRFGLNKRIRYVFVVSNENIHFVCGEDSLFDNGYVLT